MKPNEDAVPARRVGTFTFGLILVATGLGMLAALFFPQLDLRLLLRLSPLALISLGIEVLLAARDGGKLRYDWVGMLLCSLIVLAAIAWFSVAWYLTYWQDCPYF